MTVLRPKKLSDCCGATKVWATQICSKCRFLAEFSQDNDQTDEADEGEHKKVRTIHRYQ